jgi:hypothetical protein
MHHFRSASDKQPPPQEATFLAENLHLCCTFSCPPDRAAARWRALVNGKAGKRYVSTGPEMAQIFLFESAGGEAIAPAGADVSQVNE